MRSDTRINRLLCQHDTMEPRVKLTKNQSFQNLLANRGVPILFVVVCFLVIANTRCDQVGSANALSDQKKDPLRMLREIYLDHDSKIITFLPTSGDTVQKFHPNGRYGRRSVGSMADPASAHSELGRLKFGSEGSYRSAWDAINRASKLGDTNQGTREGGKFGTQQQSNESNNNQMLVADPSNLEQELNKLLKCNYAGISNLYWCDTGN